MASKYLQYNKGKISLFLILSLVGVFSFWQREMIGYLWMQGKGQLSIVSNTIPLDDVLKSDTISAKNRFLLELIPEIKSFSEKELGRNYNSLDSLISNRIVEKHAIWASKQK